MDFGGTLYKLRGARNQPRQNSIILGQLNVIAQLLDLLKSVSPRNLSAFGLLQNGQTKVCASNRSFIGHRLRGLDRIKQEGLQGVWVCTQECCMGDGTVRGVWRCSVCLRYH